jgi:hypothetical protein
VDSGAGLDDVEKILDPTGTRIPIPRSSSPQPVAIPTELFQQTLVRYTELYLFCKAAYSRYGVP